MILLLQIRWHEISFATVMPNNLKKHKFKDDKKTNTLWKETSKLFWNLK